MPSNTATPQRPRPAIIQRKDSDNGRSYSWSKSHANSYMVEPLNHSQRSASRSPPISRPESPAALMHESYLSDRYDFPMRDFSTLERKDDQQQHRGAKKYAQRQLVELADRPLRAGRPKSPVNGLKTPDIRPKSFWEATKGTMSQLFTPASNLDPGEDSDDEDPETQLSSNGSVMAVIKGKQTVAQESVNILPPNAKNRRFSRGGSKAIPTPPPLEAVALTSKSNTPESLNDAEDLDLVAVDTDFEKVLRSKEPLKIDADSPDSRKLRVDTVSIEQATPNTSPTINFPESASDNTLQASSQPLSTVLDCNIAPAKSKTFLLSTRKGWWLFRVLKYYLFDQFASADLEKRYELEVWAAAKPAAAVSSIFLLATWIALSCTRMSPFSKFDKIAYFGFGAPANIVPLLFVVLDFPARRPWLWQIQIFYTTWYIPCCVLWEAGLCHYFDGNLCPYKEFTGMLTWPMAFPPVALFILQAKRISVAIGAIAYIVMFSALLGPHRRATPKDMVNFGLYISAILTVSYLRERHDRQRFILREQLRLQFKATQQAQIKLKVAAESNQAFASYIFHEVRIPLNTGLLACQNLTAEGILPSSGEQVDMAVALSGSLLQMETVLNDNLDFERMRHGKLKWTKHPFNVHSALQECVNQQMPTAKSRRLSIITHFDPLIDEFFPLLESDRARLTQIISNLISNSSKFTPPDGTITCTTNLLYPPITQRTTRKAAQEADIGGRRDIAIVRFAVQDTGKGIRSSDLTDAKLFSPYVRTELGRRSQGGKLSGLGLALVKQSVSLAGGRLGVQSAFGVGSTFWVELTFGIPGSPC